MLLAQYPAWWAGARDSTHPSVLACGAIQRPVWIPNSPSGPIMNP